MTRQQRERDRNRARSRPGKIRVADLLPTITKTDTKRRTDPDVKPLYVGTLPDPEALREP